MGTIKSITVEGFKSIRELKDFELNNLNIIVGANGAGKSNFIQIFKMLLAMSQGAFQHFIKITRQHWHIESNLHWNLDVVYAEDKSRVKKENAPSNFNVLRKTSLCLLQRAKKLVKKYISKIDLQVRYMANPRNIVKILKGEPLCCTQRRKGFSLF